LAGCATVVGEALSAEVAKGARQVKDLLDTQNLKLAFTNLYRMQKTLAKSETIGEQDLNCYLVLAYVLTGALAPGVEDNSVDWWQRI
jgi:leucyl-tRNA synthetase